MTGEASAQPAPQCETVYDETQQAASAASMTSYGSGSSFSSGGGGSTDSGSW